MNNSLFEKLNEEGHLSAASYGKIRANNKAALFSLHWELTTILYLGVLLLTGGLSVLVYKNIDTIGHQAILLFIALTCAGCFIYCFKKKLRNKHGDSEKWSEFDRFCEKQRKSQRRT